MNKYDFDFKKIEDILYDVLGITNATDSNCLKLQIRESLNELNSTINKKNAKYSQNNLEKENNKKFLLSRELEEISNETNLEILLRKCITIKYMTLLSLDIKIRPTDSYEEKMQKKQRRSEIFALCDLVKSVPSLVDFINERKNLLKRIDLKNRVIKFDIKPNEENKKDIVCDENDKENEDKDKNTNNKSLESTKEDSDNLKIEEIIPSELKPIFENGIEIKSVKTVDESSDENKYPPCRLDIMFTKKPRQISGECGELLEKSGIYAYKFGDLVYSQFPNEFGNYTLTISRKNLIGIIKKDEFGELKKYSIFMNDVPNNVSPEFCKDILFSDMLLRNSKNNLGFIGVPEIFRQDRIYGYRVVFDDIGIQDLLTAISLENDPLSVSVNSNVRKVKGVNDALSLIQEKLTQIEKEVFGKNKEVGDD